MKAIPKCPYLGSVGDRELTQASQDGSHRCYAQTPPGEIDPAHQRTYCLTGSYWNCSAYVEPEPEPTQEDEGAAAAAAGPAPRFLRAAPWVALGLLAVVVAAIYGRTLLRPDTTPSAAQVTAPQSPPAPSGASSSVGGASPGSTGAPPEVVGGPPAGTPAATATASLIVAAQASSLPTSTPEPGGRIVALAPEQGASGWWASGETALHLDDSYLYAGNRQNQALLSAFRLKLGSVPRGAPIKEATLRLTGLSSDHFDSAAGGAWTVQLLDAKAAPDLTQADFQALYNAPAAITLLPALYPVDLQPGEENNIRLDAASLDWLEKQLLDGAQSVVARVTGPGAGETLFAWDSGFGAKTQGKPPRLVLSLGAPPATPPPMATAPVIVATLTPTPANVLTAAADALSSTAVATALGTNTPFAYAVVTPTPEAENLATAQARSYAQGAAALVIDTATPANPATATADALFATAVAITTGTFTPVPTGAVTAVILMPTPMPGNEATAVVQLLRATEQAAQIGTATAPPPGAFIATRTPEPPVVASTPTPGNAATRAILVAKATLAALTTGGYTPVPSNARTPTPAPTDLPPPTATPLPLLVLVTPRPAPSPTPGAGGGLPAALTGRILFRSDRDGATGLFALDPVTGSLFWVTQEWPFLIAQAGEGNSPDGRFTADVQTVTEVTATNPQTGAPSATRSTAVIFVRSNEYRTSRELTTNDRFSYDPAWSPAGDAIAFVARGDNDEIYVVDPDGANLRRLTNNTWEWDKHPSWSPDGKQIVFWSNRQTGRRQLWIMNADGSNQRPLMPSSYNDWDPIWVK